MKDERNWWHRYEVAEGIPSTPPTKRDQNIAMIVVVVILSAIMVICYLFNPTAL